MKFRDLVEGFGSDEITPYGNGYTIWTRRQAGPKVEKFWVFKTPEGLDINKDKFKFEKAIKNAEPIAKVNDLKAAFAAMEKK